MSVRHAECGCGSLRVACTGEPLRISICHCIACQRRTGAPFSAQSRFRRDQISVEGESRQFTRRADSGNSVTFHFCPRCASTVYWELSGYPDLIAVALGMFADAAFPPPRVSVWEATKHPWTSNIDRLDMEHS